MKLKVRFCPTDRRRLDTDFSITKTDNPLKEITFEKRKQNFFFRVLKMLTHRLLNKYAFLTA